MLKIVHIPNRILFTPTKPVKKIDQKIKKLVAEMEEALIAHKDPEGVGLAAPQVGVNLSLFIIKAKKTEPTQVFINPKIIELKHVPEENSSKSKTKKKNLKLEGCLSVPRIWSPIKRSDSVLVEYQDLSGNWKKEWFSGFKAQIIQHETDHLKGILFTQRALEQKQKMYREIDGELRPIEI
jgi:peptide deformylase